ncbi:hypothetical protein ACTNDZ_12425 [Selenomonas montiformis]|uniref:hypothetical protein n=1 Tax=Selenomonas montiformis TaxID=2652285 RepID=UPI003F8C4FE6
MRKNIIKKGLSVLFATCFIATNVAGINPKVVKAGGISSSLLLGLFGGNKIGDSTTYMATPPDDWNIYVYCTATNAAAKRPVNGGVGTYTCATVLTGKSSKYALINSGGTVTAKMSYSGEEGDKQSTTVYMPYIRLGDIDEDTGKRKTSNEKFPIIITATLQSDSTQTAITTGTATDAMSMDITSTNENNSGSNGSGTTANGSGTNSGGENACSDGSYWCPEESGNNYTDNGNADNGNINNGSTNNGNTDNGGINNGNTDDKTPSLEGNTTLPNQTWSNDTGKTYADLINDLLDDNPSDSYNSTNPNWEWSNPSGNDASDTESFPNLDDYFNGTEIDNGKNLDGMTTDDTGLTGLTDENGNPYGDANDYYSSEKANNNDGVTLDYIPDGNNYYGGNGGKGDNSSNQLGDWDGIPEAYKKGVDTLNDSLNSDNSNLLGDMALDSIGGKLSNMLNNSLLGNNPKNTVSDQNLYDMAKKWLLANGYTADDISKGRNYDANSAYTEPSVAWDMNRITTLLKGKKISLTSPNEVKNKNNDSVLKKTMKAAQEDQQAKAKTQTLK